MYFADLHVHTDVSDGSETAETILREAKEKGITHIAFTDHDTTKDAPKHKELSASFGIQAVTGWSCRRMTSRVRKKCIF